MVCHIFYHRGHKEHRGLSYYIIHARSAWIDTIAFEGVP